MTMDLIAHLGNLLFAAAYLVRGMIWLRILSILGCLASAFYSYFAPEQPLWVPIYWNIFFIVVNVIWCVTLYRERLGIRYSEDEKEMYETVFNALSPLEFVKLLRVGEWATYSDGERLATEGEPVENLVFIFNGSASVDRGGNTSATLRDGAFIGEMALTTGNAASATVIAQDELKSFRWRLPDLRKLFQRNPTLSARFHAVIGTDMARKIAGMG